MKLKKNSKDVATGIILGHFDLLDSFKENSELKEYSVVKIGSIRFEIRSSGDIHESKHKLRIIAVIRSSDVIRTVVINLEKGTVTLPGGRPVGGFISEKAILDKARELCKGLL